MTIYVEENRRICPNCGEPLTDRGSHYWDMSKRCETDNGCGLTFVVGEYLGRKHLDKTMQERRGEDTEQTKTWFTRIRDKWA